MNVGRVVLILAGLSLIVWVALIAFSPTDAPQQTEETAEQSDREFPLAERQTSPYLNTHPDVDFVGSAKCAQCHQEEHASYARTTHSQAMSDVALETEPPDVEYFHEASRKWYRVERRDGKMWHSEFIRTADGQQLMLNDYPMHVAIGSGHHSRSYLVDMDGFMIESPITWYTARKDWAMSPGYDVPRHQSFERMADVGCLFCHTGRVESLPDSAMRVNIREHAVGCESCHGPGELHVQRYSSPTPPTGEDLTIVNPARLDERLREYVCAQCHLRGEATVAVRGRKLTDFRPGLPLHDIRTDYDLASDRRMTVVGHGEQMRASRCYTASGTMNCTSCHDPHAFPTPEQRVAFYRSRCMTCHTDESCGLELAERHKVTAEDSCAQCHMPKTDTDIPHFAFTHHRIALPGAHGNDVPDEQVEDNELVAISDVSHLSETEQKRSLGLAYIEWADNQKSPARIQMLRRRGIGLLEEATGAGMNDPDSLSEISVSKWEENAPTAAAYAERAIAESMIRPAGLVNALYILGDQQLRRGDLAAARKTLERLVQNRRNAEDWFLLAVCRHRQGEEDAAIAAMEKAIEISPERLDLRSRLVEILKSAGRAEAARRQERELQLLQQWLDEFPAASAAKQSRS